MVCLPQRIVRRASCCAGELRAAPSLIPPALPPTTHPIHSSELTAETAALLARKMQLGATASADGLFLDVLVPPSRPDILHECDIVEDVAIAYGYNKLVRTLPQNRPNVRRASVRWREPTPTVARCWPRCLH